MPTTEPMAGNAALPAPTGPYPVGRREFDWIDASRAEIYAAGARRELAVFVWYPAAPSPEAAPYFPPAWVPAGAALGVEVAGASGHALADAAVAEDGAPYPVLLLSPSGVPPLLLSAYAQELASHGFVVVGVNHTYETAVTAFADGRVLPMNPAAVGGALGPQTGSPQEVFGQRGALCEYKAADLRSVADQVERLNAVPGSPFAGRLDLSRVGAVGHSFGGDAALQWCRDDPRCRAAVNLDGALWSEIGREGLARPVLQILAPHPEFAVTPQEAVEAGMAPTAEWFEAERSIAYGGWRTVQQQARPGYTFQIAGATHVSFMDAGFLPLQDKSMIKNALAMSGITPMRMWRITSDLLLAFFGRHLDGNDAPLLDGPSDGYPELSLTPP
jgi:predicted dienelactone hydrolase